MTFDDIPDLFGGWPEAKRAYQRGNRYDIYTSLSTSDYDKAVNLCDSAYSDILGGGNETPEIVVSSAGNPPTILASGASPGAGCTSLKP